MINKTGEWITILKHVPVVFPVNQLEVYFAKPKNAIIPGFRTITGTNILQNRMMELGRFVRVNNEKDYYDYILRYLNDDDTLTKREREELKFHVTYYNYSMESFEDVVEIITPYGPCTLFPEEYKKTTLEWALDMVDEGAYMLRYLDNNGKVRDKIKRTDATEKLFYLQSRGIGYTRAMKILSGEIKTQHLFYFDPFPPNLYMIDNSFVNYLIQKQKYCTRNGYPDLLEYSGDPQNGDYSLMDFLDNIDTLKLVG